MSLELIAVQGMTVEVDQSTVVPPGDDVVAIIAVIPPTGTKAQAGALVHRDGDTISVTAITVPTAGATIADPGPYVVPLNATATKVKAEGVVVLVFGDHSDTINATPQIPGSPPVDYPVSFQCHITDANQTKTKAQ